MYVILTLLMSVNTQAASVKKAEPVKASASEVASAEASVVTVGVNGMVCSFCAQGIEKKFSEVKSIEKVNVDLDNKKVILNYKKGEKHDEAQIRKIIKEAGYDVVDFEVSKIAKEADKK